MKIQIETKLHKSYPSGIGELLKAISEANGQIKEDAPAILTMQDVVGFLRVNKAAYFPANQFKWVINDNEMQISFSNDLTKGLTLIWKEVTELTTSTDMDMATMPS